MRVALCRAGAAVRLVLRRPAALCEARAYRRSRATISPKKWAVGLFICCMFLYNNTCAEIAEPEAKAACLLVMFWNQLLRILRKWRLLAQAAIYNDT